MITIITLLHSFTLDSPTDSAHPPTVQTYVVAESKISDECACGKTEGYEIQVASQSGDTLRICSFTDIITGQMLYFPDSASNNSNVNIYTHHPYTISSYIHYHESDESIQCVAGLSRAYPVIRFSGGTYVLFPTEDLARNAFEGQTRTSEFTFEGGITRTGASYDVRMWAAQINNRSAWTYCRDRQNVMLSTACVGPYNVVE